MLRNDSKTDCLLIWHGLTYFADFFNSSSNYVFSMATASGLLALFSTSSK